MLMSTHFLIANSILENIDNNKSFFISEKNFIYGNIKPDISSKYVFLKHYRTESLGLITFKVNYLCNLNLDSLSKYFSLSKFNQELGVICHFLCDFFCVPHSQRWEFKHSMKKHMLYERELSAIAKELNLSKFKGDVITHNSFEDFFHALYEEYINKSDYKNDLLFSSYACNSVVNYILDCILENTVSAHNIAHCV
ncbi:zinc dependent phospholipase C family protein [Romboutsia sp.]|uniref:zinc dependent phospholipase C family protein n=1 Tax=Romboutsia sp. TaxID=1965302 RepID=UPI002BB0A563|nr:zinc dependent phospholipase C family protein [Romboutsia sp.]HSQ89625.1 zinc dependent phospholipase C family protein [Romboutsia sp.]